MVDTLQETQLLGVAESLQNSVGLSLHGCWHSVRGVTLLMRDVDEHFKGTDLGLAVHRAV